MLDIDRDARLSRATDILESDVNGEVIALDIERGNCYGLNGTASRVWEMLGSGTSLAEICAALTARFDVAEDQCEREVRALLGELDAEGLLRVEAR